MRTHSFGIAVGAALRLARVLCAVALWGCATASRGTTEIFVVHTTPSGASVHSEDWECVSPCRVEVQRRGDFYVTIKKEGYQTVVKNVSSRVAASGPVTHSVGGVLGAVGRGVDSATGAKHEVHPNPLRVRLVPIE